MELWDKFCLLFPKFLAFKIATLKGYLNECRTLIADLKVLILVVGCYIIRLKLLL